MKALTIFHPVFFLVFSFLSIHFCIGQGTILTDSYSKNVRGEINLIQDQFSGVVDLDTTQNNRIESIEVSLVNAEIVISYVLAPTEENHSYDVALGVTLDGQPLSIRRENILGTYGTAIESTGEEKRNLLTWLLERYGNIEGTLEVNLIANHNYVFNSRFELDCDNPPVFGSREKIPYYIGAGVGVGMIATGLAMKTESNNIYDTEYLKAETAQAAQPFLDKAQSKHDAFVILTAAGAAILIGDAVLYYFRNKRHKEWLEDLDKFCEEQSIGFKPLFEPSFSPANPGQLGMRFTYTF